MAEKIWIVPTREIAGPDGKPLGPVLREVIDAREACRDRVGEDGEKIPADWAFAPDTAQAFVEADEVMDEAARVAKAAAARREKARKTAEAAKDKPPA